MLVAALCYADRVTLARDDAKKGDPGTDDPADRRARGAVGLMFDRVFGALFWGKMFSVVAVWTHGIVAAIVVYDATRSALMVGMVGVAQFGPQLLLTPTSGKWADTGRPIRQILLGRVFCAAGSGAAAAWLFTASSTQGTAAAVAVLLGSLLVGFGFAIGGPAMQSIVPSLIRDGELSTAMALNSMPMTVGRILGPAAGAYLAAHLGPASAFAASAGLHLVFAVFLIVVRFPVPPARRSEADYRVRVAIRYVMGDRRLLLALVAVAVVGVASDSSITLTPSVVESLGGDTRMVGMLSAVFGVGAAVGMGLLAVLRGRIGADLVSWLGLWGMAAGCSVLAVGTVTIVAVAGFALAGVGFGWAMTGLGTVVQEQAPEELRGRIMALWLVGFLGSRPLAAAVLGGTADAVGVYAAFGVAAVLCGVVIVLCRPSRMAGRGRGDGQPQRARKSTEGCRIARKESPTSGRLEM
ncbi:MFS transporter [Mycolicibacterium sp. 3033]|nr:MFS transporter [Mycolicibacterium aurantiacum]